MSELGRLKPVDLREVWKNESSNFTPWLAGEENLKLLGETIDIELELEAEEKAVGPFSADILCKSTVDGHWVLIENQLERTDHTHLGQLLTYAAGLKAVTIVWVAKQFTEEHRAALDWLNDITDERFNFFGLEVELWRIGDSPIAPKFNLVNKPNDWSKSVQSSAKQVGELTPAKELQLRFWTAFREFMNDNGSSVRCQKPLPQHWTNHAIGRSGFHMASIASHWNSADNTYDPEIRVEVIIVHPEAKKAFASLEQQKSTIEEELGGPIVWYNPDNKKMSKMYIRKSSDFSKDENWPEQFAWLQQNLVAFHNVFSNRIKQLAL